MPGQKISSMTLVHDLQDIDQIPIARNGSTYRIRGLSLASRFQINALSAKVEQHAIDIGNMPGLLSTTIEAVSSSFILKPSVPRDGQVLAFDRSTTSWVASSVSFLPKPEVASPYNVLTYNAETFSWQPSSPPDMAEAFERGVPTGAIIPFPTLAIPKGWVACKGQMLDNTIEENKRLYALIGHTYGGFGEFFRVLDLRGYFIRGWDDGKGIDPGRALNSIQDDEFESPASPGNEPYVDTNLLVMTPNVSGGIETRPKNIALIHCIKL